MGLVRNVQGGTIPDTVYTIQLTCTQGRIQDFLKGGAGLAELLRNLQSQGRSHTPPR